MNKKSLTNCAFYILILLIPTTIILYNKYDSSNYKTNIIYDVKEQNNSYNNSNNTKLTNNKNMIAVWVPFMSLNLSGSDYSEQTFKTKFNDIIKVAKEHNINTLIVSIRSHGDALYPSSYFPWSHIISKKQGVNPGYDPLKYMVQATHEADMEFHAWINPFRIQSLGYPKELSDNNPCIKFTTQSDALSSNPIIEYENCKYYNPACSEVRELIINGVKEVVSKYDVDGIQFDDYFYPTTNEEFDSTSYQEYISKTEKNSIPLSLTEWRINNINSLISGVYSSIKFIKNDVKFGISPAANIEKDISLGADVITWGCKNGYVDYLCPQIYFSLEHPIKPYKETVDKWKSIITNPNIKFYIGLGIYKAGSNADYGTWKLSDNIIAREIEYGKSIGCNGFMMYSWEYLNNQQSANEIQNAINIIKE